MKSSARNDAGYTVVSPLGARIEPPRDHPVLSPVAAVGETLYRLGAFAMRQVRSSRRNGPDGGVVVVSVGNLEVGGNGKTPFAIHLLRHLRGAGRSPVYVSRAFKGVAEKLAAVTVVLPEGLEAMPALGEGLRLVSRSSPGLHVEIGDEGAMVTALCPRVPALFARNRRRAISAARRMFEPTHIVLDDAFQTWAVRRDVDVVLLDAREPFANGRLLPAGRLREAPGALARADIVALNGFDDSVDLESFARRLRALCGRDIPVCGLRRSNRFVDPISGEGVGRPAGAVAALSSIARPDRFEQGLVAAGVDLRVAVRYPDHYCYTPEDITNIGRVTAQHKIACLITTDKDWVKLSAHPPSASDILIARLDMELTDPAVLQQIEKPQASPAAF